MTKLLYLLFFTVIFSQEPLKDTTQNISIVSTGPDRKETIDINGTLSNI